VRVSAKKTMRTIATKKMTVGRKKPSTALTAYWERKVNHLNCLLIVGYMQTKKKI